MLRSNSHLKQLPAHYGCYVVTSSSSNLEEASDATFQQPFQSTSRTLCMLRCTIASRLNPKGLSNIWNRETSQHMPPCPPLNPSPPKCPLVPRLNPKGLSNIWNRETSQHMPPGPPQNPSPPKCPLVPRLNPKGLSNIWNRETSQHMPPCPPLNPSPPKCPLVPRLNPKGLSNIWNRETSQHMPPCPPLNPSPPKSPLVPRLNPKGLSNIFKLLLFRGECDPFWFRGECDPLLGANVTPVPSINLTGCCWAIETWKVRNVDPLNMEHDDEGVPFE